MVCFLTQLLWYFHHKKAVSWISQSSLRASSNACVMWGCEWAVTANCYSVIGSGLWCLWEPTTRTPCLCFQEKVSRLDRIVAEHNQFSLGIKDLQDWMTDAVHMLDSYCHPTSDKSVLDSRMLKLEVCTCKGKCCLEFCLSICLVWGGHTPCES